jgi:hypothetical protein
VARILDQLSVSAWLPSGALVFIALLYANLRTDNGNPVSAIGAISSMGWGSLILVIGAIVLTTIVSQAFEFEAIQLLEGYWGTGWFATRLADVGCAIHIRRRDRLQRRKEELENDAFARARMKMHSVPELRLIADILEAERLGEAMPARASKGDIQKARRYSWFNAAPPNDVRRLLELSRRLESDYPPEPYRVLPTRLGNVMRAHEDRINPGNGSLHGMVQRVFHKLPDSLQTEHDQFRSRLDLYCSMFIVFVFAAVAALPVLGWSNWRSTAVTAAAAVGLAFLSYRAAIASARPYGIVLETIESLEKSGEIGGSSPSAPASKTSVPAAPAP